MEKKLKFYLFPFLLFIFTLFVQLSLISTGPYHQDCMTFVAQVEKTIATHKINYLHNHGYPLTIMMGFLFTLIAQKVFLIQDPLVALNFMNVFFSALCLSPFYSLTKRLFDTTSATLAGVLLALGPVFLGASTFCNSHFLSLFFILLGICFLLTYFDSSLKKHFILSGIFLGLGGAARLQDMIPLFPAIFVLFILRLKNPDTGISRKNIIKGSVFFMVYLGITLLSLFLIYFHLLVTNWAHLAYIWKTQIVQKSVNLSLFKLGILNSCFYLKDNFSLLGLICIISGIFFSALRNKINTIFLFLWFLIPFLMFSKIDYNVPRYLIVSMTPLYIFIGYFLSKFLRINKYFSYISFTVFSILCFVNLTFIYPLLIRRHQHSYIKEYCLWLKDTTEENARYIAADETVFIEYYTKHKCIRRPLYFDDINKEDLEKFEKVLDSHLSKNIPVYITGAGLQTYDPLNKFSTLIKKYYNVKFVGESLSEDWHQGTLYNGVWNEPLFRISPKSFEE